jgi:hypothetical protein
LYRQELVRFDVDHLQVAPYALVLSVDFGLAVK